MGTLQGFTGQLVFFLHILMQIRTSGLKYIHMIWCIGIKHCINMFIIVVNLAGLGATDLWL